MKLISEITLSEDGYQEYKGVETSFRCSNVYDKIFEANIRGSNLVVVQANELENKDYNLRGLLINEGFLLVNRPQKKVAIVW